MDFEILSQKFEFKKIKTGYTYNGANLRITNISRKDGENMTRKQMIKLCDAFLGELRLKYPEAEGLVSVSIKYSQRWYSSNVTAFNQPINYFTPSDSNLDFDDPNEYEAIRFQFIPFKRIREGGADDMHNDCLFKCLLKFFRATKKYLDPVELKQHLKLNRDDKIPISMMADVETFINDEERHPFAIFISGDAEYISPIKTNKKIHVVLSNGHYSVNEVKTIKSIRKNYEEKPIVMVDFVDGEYQAFDGEKCFVISKQEYDDARYKYLSSPFLLVNKDVIKDTREATCIEDAFFTYIEIADDLKTISNGKFNFYKTPTVKNMALNHFYELTKSIQPDEINNSEAEWINKASFHAITYWEKYKGDVHVYDINSRYPHIMQKSINHFPIKEGTWRTITKIEDKPEYGIYRCIITGPDIRPYKFFVFNPENYYTHLDIVVAREYGMIIILVDDGPNFLHYSKDCLMSGSFLFKKYVEDLYPLKQEKCKGAKLLLNILWGALTETKLFKQTTDPKDKFNLSGVQITRLQTDTHIRTHYTKHQEGLFRTNYGRIKPFVLAYARSQMFFSFRKWEPLVVRIHTDSLYLTNVPHDMLPPSNKLGCLKCEYEGHIEINGLNKVIKKEKGKEN